MATLIFYYLSNIVLLEELMLIGRLIYKYDKYIVNLWSEKQTGLRINI